MLKDGLMNSRERVLSTIKRQSIDRVPYDFWAENTTLEKIYQTVGHRNIESLLKDFHVDLRHIEATMPEEINYGNFFQNFWGERYIYKQTQWGPVREDMKGALYDVNSIEDIKNFYWPSPDSFDYSNLKNLCAINNEYAIMYGFADIWQRPALIRGMQNALMDLVLNPDWVHFLSRKFTDFYKEDYTRAQKASDVRIDILDPIQPICENMKPENLAKSFGNRICFHGGIDIQNLLPCGTPEDVKREVIHYANILGKNGGYISCPAHLFQPDIPVENIFA